MSHYTNADEDAFVNRITFDFIAQVANKLETSQTRQNELAEKLNVSEGAVSQVLSLVRMNLTLKTMVRYARALGMKLAVVAYDDHDPQNEHGPVGSEIFSLSWEKLGKPRNIWGVTDANYATEQSFLTINDWRFSFTNSTVASTANTSGEWPGFAGLKHTLLEATTYARDKELHI